LEGSDDSVIEAPTRHLPGETEEIPENKRITAIPAEIQKFDLPNSSTEHRSYTIQLGIPYQISSKSI
jgi:hypothetical protein